jgi:hypothetical protein
VRDGLAAVKKLMRGDVARLHIPEDGFVGAFLGSMRQHSGWQLEFAEVFVTSTPDWRFRCRWTTHTARYIGNVYTFLASFCDSTYSLNSVTLGALGALGAYGFENSRDT